MTLENFDSNAATDNSIEEALIALVIVAPNIPGTVPELPVILDWTNQQNIYAFLNSSVWGVRTSVATSYALDPTGAEKKVWTDYLPKTLPGDLDGDLQLTSSDVTLYNGFLTGDYNLDGVVNGQDDVEASGTLEVIDGVLRVVSFPLNFSSVDKNYDGVIDRRDHPFYSRFTVDEFIACLLGPGVSVPLECDFADTNADGVVDGRDIQAWQIELVAGANE